MAGTLNLNIVAPHGEVLNKDVEFVVVPGENGELGILPYHAPLIAALGIGILRYTQNNKTYNIAVSGGFVEVVNNKVTVLANVAEIAQNIDLDRAQSAKDRAEKRLQERSPEIDIARAELALKRAITRIRAAQQ